MAEAISNFMVVQGHVNVSEAVRELCAMALASDPYSGSLATVRTMAFNEIKRWASWRLSGMLMELSAELQAANIAEGK